MFMAPGFRILGISLAFLFFIKWKSFNERAGLLKPYYRRVAHWRRSPTVSVHLYHLSSAWSGEPEQSGGSLPDDSRMNLQEYAELRGMDKESLLQL